MSGRGDGAAPVVRVLVAGLIVIAPWIVVLLFGGGGGYRVTAEFVNAGQLVKGSEVRVAGVTVGTVEDIDVSQSGTAEITFSVNDDYAPLRQGTQAIDQAHLAVRYREPLRRPAARPARAARTSRTAATSGPTTPPTAVELDEVFALFDKDTRASLQDVIKGQADTVRGRGRPSCGAASTT